MARIIVDGKFVRKHLEEQLRLLSTACVNFDEGMLEQAKSISVIIRKLFRDTKSQVALLKQSGLESRKIIDSRKNSPDNNEKIFYYLGLVTFIFSDGFMKYACNLGGGEFVAQGEWWASTVAIAPNGKIFSRERIACVMADQDGGAHIDPKIDEDYHDLFIKNTLGFSLKRGNLTFKAKNPHYYIIRQMAHEILCSLVDGYPMDEYNEADSHVVKYYICEPRMEFS